MEKKVSTDSNLLSNAVKSEFVDILGSCRLCMGRSDHMKDIFEENEEDIIKKVEYCTGLTLTKEDCLPSQICETCIYHLTISHSFKTSCLVTEETFRKLLLSSVKVEKAEPDVEINDDDDFKWQEDEHVQDVLRGVLTLSDDVNLKKENESPEPLLVKPKKKRGPYKKKIRNEKKPSIKKKYPPKMSCDICNVTFKTRKECREHRTNKHDESWICEICGKVFTVHATYYSHIPLHFPPNYQCDTCDYKTYYRHDLVKHLRIHTGEKNYQCEYCTKSVRTSSSLIDHIRRNHIAINRGRYPCHLCDKKFYDRTKLNRHIDSHNDVKRFPCDKCSSAFTRRCYWKKHLLQRHGIVIPPQRPGRKTTDVLKKPTTELVASDS